MRGFPDRDVARTVSTFTFSYTNAGSCTTWGADPAAPFSPDADCANDILVIVFPELTDTGTGRPAWDGRDTRGGWVPNGIYLVQAQTTDTTTGSPVTITRSLALAAYRPEVTARIYNAAGLVVATLPVLALPGVERVRADTDFFSPDVAGASLITFTFLGATDAALGVLAWNGRNDAGRVVPDGAYLLGVAVTGSGDATRYLTAGFTVSHGPLDLVRDVVAVPNPVGRDAATAWFRYAPTAPGAVRTVGVRIYNVAGEPVAEFDATGQAAPADPLDRNASGAGAVSWDLRPRRGRRVAPGLYLAVLDFTGPGGLAQRVIRRLALR